MIRRSLAAVAAAMICSFSAGIASAEDITYEFDDDLLDADGLDTKAALIKVRKKEVRTTLIRPRGSFVPELLKSVEHL